VRAERISKEEKPLMVNAVFASRAEFFGYTDIALDERAKAMLEEYEAQQVLQIVDGALRTAIVDRQCEITPELIRQTCREQGVGGARREFGFMGGTMYA